MKINTWILSILSMIGKDTEEVDALAMTDKMDNLAARRECHNSRVLVIKCKPVVIFVLVRVG